MELLELVPDTDIRTWVGPYQDRTLYLESGKYEADRFIELAHIQPNHHVLDFGCGCGRIAIHLAEYLRDGRYMGIDSCKTLLEWCYNKIAPVFTNCAFQLIDIYNGAYSPDGKTSPAEMHIDLPDDSVDIMIANSLFTHMFIEDIAGYLKEMQRILRPGGTLAATYLLLNDKSIAALNAGETRIDLMYHVRYRSLSKDEKTPEEGIGHDETVIRSIYSELGFEIDAVYDGDWVRNDGKDFQDLIISRNVSSQRKP